MFQISEMQSPIKESTRKEKDKNLTSVFFSFICRRYSDPYFKKLFKRSIF